MENAEVARVPGEIADLLALTGGNAFEVRAYRRAAQVVDVAELRRRLARERPPGRRAQAR